MKVQASAVLEKRAKATPGYDACSFKPLMEPRIRRSVIWLNTIVALPNDEGPTERPSPSLTVSW
jgi:hypothetical protein